MADDVQVGHGVGCVSLVVYNNGSNVAGVVLTPTEADELAIRLIRQAGHARELVPEEAGRG